MQVVIVGATQVEAKLGALPEQLHRAAHQATTQATTLEAQAIRAVTPRRSGTLIGSIETEVTQTADGARGRAFSDLRYAPFVDHGTRRHGAARQMFERGSQAAKSPGEDLYRAAVDEVAASFG